MKNIYKYMIVTLAAVSCAKEEEEIITGGDGKEVDIQVVGRIVDTPDTKTYMGTLDTSGEQGVYPVLWSKGDEIGLVTGGGSEPVKLTLSGDGDTKEALFGGKAGDIVAPFPGTDYYPAAYPATKAFAETKTNTILVGSYLPYKQNYKAGTFDDNVFPLAALSTDQGSYYDFYNLCGVVQLKIKADDTKLESQNQIRAIYFYGNNHEALAGGVGMHFDLSTGKPVVSTEAKDGPDQPSGLKYNVDNYGSEAYERIIIDFGTEPLQLTSETTYINIAIIPQTFTKGFTVELVDAGNLGSSTKVIENEITIQRSCVKSMQEFVYLQSDPLQIANSYIYSEPGYYIMPGYCMGNRLDVNLPTQGRDLAAALLWTDLVDASGNDLGAVTNIEYVPFADGKGMLQFKINIDPATGKAYRGNSAIALYDTATNEVLWSWHIWMCEEVSDVLVDGYCADGSYDCQYPDGSEYHYVAETATSAGLVIMDRNLGAISSNPADGWKTYGLYYQNGRRDGFIGGHYNGSYSHSSTTSMTGSYDESYMGSVRYDESTPFGTATATCWYNEQLAPDGWEYVDGYITPSTAIAFPMSFSNGSNTGATITKAGGKEQGVTAQWTNYNDTDNKEWLDESLGGIHGQTGLTDNGHEAYWNRTKTIFDPCPVGYSVLGERNGQFFGTGNGSSSKSYRGSSSNGYGLMDSYTYSGKTYKVWFPAAGVRTFTGRMANVGYCGAYFHYDHINASHGGHGTYFYISGSYAGTLSTTNGTITNHAASVRCVRDKQDLSHFDYVYDSATGSYTLKKKAE